MSRSYRRPYAPVTTVKSAKDDKRLAHRGERRAQNHALRTAKDYEELVIPVKRECAWNDPWSWGRDGNQKLRRPPHWESYYSRLASFATLERIARWFERDVRAYERLFRK